MFTNFPLKHIFLDIFCLSSHLWDSFGDSLENIIVDSANEKYTSIGGVLFNNRGTELIWYPREKKGSYVVPEKVTSIGSGAFRGCSSLKSIVIPKGVTSIDGSFAECDNLVIYGFQGSTAQIYANNQDIDFVVMDDETIFHSITIFDTTNGSIICQNTAVKGQDIMVEAIPDTEYQVKSILVTTADGNEIEIKKAGDNIYSFIMSDSDVTLTATFIVKGNINKEKLNTLIASAENLQEADYTAESYQTVKKALETAKQIVEKEEVTQEEVENATKVLEEAVKALKKVEVPVVVDKTKLKEVITSAEGLQGADYTTESYQAVKKALETAKQIAEKEEATQETVEKAEAELRAAIRTLVRVDGSKPVLEVVISSSKLSLLVGDSEKLTVSIFPEDADDKTLTWTSSDTSIVTVQDGQVTAQKAGEAEITVYSGNGKSASCKVTITEKVGDVKEDSWQYSAVNYVYLKGIMTGKGQDANGNTKFAPNDTLSREEFAQILYAAEGKPEMIYNAKFSDVTDGNWYTKAILWAAEKGIVSGYSNGKFGVGDNITREQLAAMLYKYAEYKKYDTTGREDLGRFMDNSQISGWAGTQIQWAVANGVLSGKGSGENVKIDAFGQATRAECAAMLRTFLIKFEN